MPQSWQYSVIHNGPRLTGEAEMRYLTGFFTLFCKSRMLRKALATAALGILTLPALADEPILFVHGNGDTAALWHTTL